MKSKLLAGFIKKKVSSATIVEITVAMVLAGTCFLLAFMVFGRVAASRFNEKSLTMELAVENLIVTTLQENRFTDETIRTEDWILHKEVSTYNGHAGLLLLVIQVTDVKGKDLLTRRQLFYVTHE